MCQRRVSLRTYFTFLTFGIGVLIIVQNVQVILPLTQRMKKARLPPLEEDAGFENGVFVFREDDNVAGYLQDIEKYCDDDCQRLRNHFSDWPQNKPKSAVYFLVQDAMSLVYPIILLEMNFLFTFPYPIIVFHEEGFNRDMLRTHTGYKHIFFQLVTFTLPEDLVGKVPIADPCTQRSIGYRHMCRFQAKMLYEEPIIEGLDYLLRLDDDTVIEDRINYDLFQFMYDNDYDYGYVVLSEEEPSCIVGLWETADIYAKNNSLSTNWFEEWNRKHIFYNNFELSRVKMWKTDFYTSFIDYIDSSGGIFTRRWGDAPIKTIAVTLSVDKEKVHHFRDISYRHQDTRQVGSVHLDSLKPPDDKVVKTLVGDNTEFVEIKL